MLNNFKIKGIGFVVILTLIFSLVSPVTVEAIDDKKVGIWYSTWYSNEAKYDWLLGHGVGSTKQFLGDVNNDGKSDAVMFWDIPGNAPYQGLTKVALANSSGTAFSTPQTWMQSGSHTGASKVFVGDVDGANGDDIVFYYSSGGQCKWKVAKSNGVNGFGALEQWHSSFGCNTEDQLLGDVDGDGDADAVIFFNNHGGYFTGGWYVSRSNGTAFTGSGTRFIYSFGQGSEKRFLADVTGDGALDAITYTSNPTTPGNWWVAKANGTNGAATGFINPSNWAANHGYGSEVQALGDVDADGKADALVYFEDFGSGTDSRWYKATSTGSTFSVPSQSSIWKLAHGNWSKSELKNAKWVGVGNVDGDINGQGYGSADPIVFHDYDDNNQGVGLWRYMPGNKYSEPNQMNIWEAYEIKTKPIINGQPGIYDTKQDTAVIDADIQRMDQAGIDYVLLDLTNNLYSWINERAKTVCERIAAYNSNGHNFKFAIAVGGSQFKAWNDVAIIEQESTYIKNNFVDDSTCGSHYFQWENKPLIANYFKDTAQKNYWNNNYPSSSKPNALTFTMRYVFGEVPHFTDSGLSPSYPSSTGDGCGTFPTGSNIFPQSNEFGHYLGWGFPYGSANPGSARTMVVQPGWNNNAGRTIARSQKVTSGGPYIEGRFYAACSWDRVINNKADTDMVVINSYNEYAEETAVAPSDTSNVQSNVPGANWSTNDLYWNTTINYINQFKN